MKLLKKIIVVYTILICLLPAVYLGLYKIYNLIFPMEISLVLTSITYLTLISILNKLKTPNNSVEDLI